MLQGEGEHSAILSTFIKLPFVIKIVVKSIFEWPLKTCFNVDLYGLNYNTCQILNKKGADQTAQRRRQVHNFVVRIRQN